MTRALVAFAALLALVWIAIVATVRLPPLTPLSPDDRTAALRALRVVLDTSDTGTLELNQVPATALHGPLSVTLFVDGAPVARATSRATTLRAAIHDAAVALAHAGVPDEARRRGRLKLDVELGRAPIYTRFESVFAFSLVPGLDGVGVRLGDGREATLGVDDLMLQDLLAAHEPLKGLDLEIGADGSSIRQALARQLALSDEELARTPKSWFRFRADASVEPADVALHGRALPVVRGNVPGPKLSKEALLHGAVMGGRYLLRHLYDDGRFGYEYTPASDLDEAFSLDYSLPRHAGATYFLAQLYAATRTPDFADGAAKALAFLAARHPGACNRADRACVGNPEDGVVDTGAAAMSLLAAVEFQAATGRRDYEPWARRLANFLVYMQKPDGDFRHLYDPRADVADDKTKLLYFSGEAAFALAKLTALLGPQDRDYARYVAALDRGLHYLTDTQYDTLAGKFYFGEDHWTCMAADAGWDALEPRRREGYAQFCDAFAAFMRRTQFGPDDAVTEAQPDFLGAYGFSPLLPPHSTPVGSRSETTISTYHMQLRRKRADLATKRQIERGLQFLLAHQIDDDAAWLMQKPEAARGGFLMSDVKRYIRIDFIQHSCSAMLRAIPLL